MISWTHQFLWFICHILYQDFTLHTVLVFNHVPVKHLPERNILPWQETHDSKRVQVSSVLKNYLEFCLLWFFGNLFSHDNYQRLHRWRLGPVEANSITGSHHFLVYPSVKKNGAFSSVGSTCVTPPELQLVGLKDLINQPQTPMAEPIQLPRISTTLTHEDQKRREGRAKKARDESRRAPSGGRDVNT